MPRIAPLLLLLLVSLSYGQIASSPARTSDMNLYLKVRLNSGITVPALKPGDVVEGKLLRPVYSGDTELFAEGSRVRLTVEGLARRRRVPNDHWPWMVKVFTPRYENYPTFQSASVAAQNGDVPLKVALISVGDEAEVLTKPGPPSKAAPTHTGTPKNSGPTVTLLAQTLTPVAAGHISPTSIAPGAIKLLAGAQARIVLLGSISASGSHPGDSFQARLAEPVQLDSRVVLPQGTIFDGMVVHSMRPRRLSRSGSLLLTFTHVTLPGGTPTAVVASVSGADLDRRSHTVIDPEGRLRGDHPGKLWMLIHAGVATGLAKVADDGTQLVIEAIASTATDASTAGTARIAAIGVSGIFLLTRHGRDVVLPEFTEMEVTFDRPAAVSGEPEGSAPH